MGAAGDGSLGGPLGAAARRGSRRPGRRAARFPDDRTSRRQLAAAVATFAPAFVETLGAFLLRSGVPAARVAAVFRQIATLALARPLQLEPRVSHLWWQVSDAISAWWSDPEYLDDDGRPRELPEFGPAPSIAALLGRTVDAADLDAAKRLLRRGAVSVTRRRWRFEEDSPFIRLAGDAAVERLLLNASGMFGTFLENQVRRRAPPGTKNFDRSAHVVACPVESIPKLRAKFVKRMQVMLQELHETLVAEERRGGRGPVAAVGVTMFMHTSTPRPRRGARSGSDTTGGARPTSRATRQTPRTRRGRKP
jgi:hypothetical protein